MEIAEKQDTLGVSFGGYAMQPILEAALPNTVLVSAVDNSARPPLPLPKSTAKPIEV